MAVQAIFAATQHIRRHFLEIVLALAKSGPMSDLKPAKPQAEPRTAYRVFRSISTRWLDNDAYGHVNNVVHYSWFDTAVNAYLIEQGVLDIAHGATIGLVIETQCNYFSPLTFPQTVEAVSYTHLTLPTNREV